MNRVWRILLTYASLSYHTISVANYIGLFICYNWNQMGNETTTFCFRIKKICALCDPPVVGTSLLAPTVECGVMPFWYQKSVTTHLRSLQYFFLLLEKAPSLSLVICLLVLAGFTIHSVGRSDSV
ncbi:hypothetical protein BGZ63DRAFT_396171 [Mariannaea sp. PMI_226]|nr:hypothetical protein BGZ63DRAFT_396171 [Mariannaea sp. PMI_226]